jgi:hypothetical protein
MLLSLNKQLLGKDTLWKQSAITSSGLKAFFPKEVIADFAGGRITSDAGGLLLRELDQRYRIAENAARCLHDPREGHKVNPF